MMKLTSPSQQQGDYYEQQALVFLQQQGLILVAKNWHCRAGELDLVMLDNQQKLPCLVVVEVRQRQVGAFGTALDSITPTKQQKIIRATQVFLTQNPQFTDYDIRFDVVAFSTNIQQTAEAEWIQSAFLAI